MKHILQFDGSITRNPDGEMYGGYVIYTEDDETSLASDSVVIEPSPQGARSNNIAEYGAMVAGLERAVEMGVKKLTVIGDSEIVIRQMNGNYRCKSKWLKYYRKKAIKLQKNFDKVAYKHVRRKHNKRADKLSRRK